MTPNQARKEEREAIVEWLRSVADNAKTLAPIERYRLHFEADRINRGDHWEGKDGK